MGKAHEVHCDQCGGVPYFWPFWPFSGGCILSFLAVWAISRGFIFTTFGNFDPVEGLGCVIFCHLTFFDPLQICQNGRKKKKIFPHKAQNEQKK